MKKWYVTFMASLLCFIALVLATNIQKNRLYDQTAADRWGEGTSQYSIIFPVSLNPEDTYYFLELAHKLENELEKSGMTDILYPDEEGIAFLQSLSIEGTVTLSTERGTFTPDAIGIDKDFFIVHPLELMYGSYISGDDLMKDGIVIDEDCAWNLFGAFDVVGKRVEIGGVPHYIKGVVRKADDRFSRAAGLERSICFISLDSLQKYGSISGSYDYEIIMPNPVDNFADNIISVSLGDSSGKILVINNSERYETAKMFGILKDFGIRSMNGKGIVYPYFENVARAWEDVFAAILVLKIISAGLALVSLFIILFRLKDKIKLLFSGFKPLIIRFKEVSYEKIDKKRPVPDAGTDDADSPKRVRKKRQKG